MEFLEVILEKKREEIQEMIAKQRKPSFYQMVKGKEQLAVIAEIKRYSPSKGLLLDEENVIERAKNYEKHGASCISVLTDQHFFKGSYQDLQQVAKVVTIPVLCKDFILSTVQIDRAKQCGASIILLILAALSDEQYEELYQYALLQQLEVLVEVHNEEELRRCLKMNPMLIGINNRNLKTFEVGLDVTTTLMKHLEESNSQAIVISESGIHSSVDAQYVKDAGVKGVLVGEALMKARNYGTLLEELQQ